MKQALDIVAMAACLWLVIVIGRALLVREAPTMEAEDDPFAADRFAADRIDIESTEPLRLPANYPIQPAFEPIKVEQPQPVTPPPTEPVREPSPDSADLPQTQAQETAPALSLFEHKTFAHAQAASHDSGRPVLGLFVGPPGTCPKCEAFQKKVLTDPQVIETLNAKVEFSLVNGEEEPALADAAQVKAYPDDVLVWPDQRKPVKFLLPLDAEEFLANLAVAMKGKRSDETENP